MKNRLSGNKLLIILLSFIIYSLSSVLSKFASIHNQNYVFFIGSIICVFVLMGIYAVLWQKILSFMPLNSAFLCKSITIIMIIGLSAIIFKERITMNNIIGTILIILGLLNLTWKE